MTNLSLKYCLSYYRTSVSKPNPSFVIRRGMKSSVEVLFKVGEAASESRIPPVVGAKSSIDARPFGKGASTLDVDSTSPKDLEEKRQGDSSQSKPKPKNNQSVHEKHTEMEKTSKKDIKNSELRKQCAENKVNASMKDLVINKVANSFGYEVNTAGTQSELDKTKEEVISLKNQMDELKQKTQEDNEHQKNEENVSNNVDAILIGVAAGVISNLAVEIIKNLDIETISEVVPIDKPLPELNNEEVD
jgi:hypothetical protein